MPRKSEGLNKLHMEELQREVMGWRVHWKEVKEWRRHWTTGSFLKALFLGFLFSLLDTGTDLNFAWNVPADCPSENFPDPFNTSSCGMIHPKKVEFLSYTYIALPGVLFCFSACSSPLKGRLCGCFGEKVLQLLGLSAQMCLGFGLFLAANFNDYWSEFLPDLDQGYGHTIRAIAFLSSVWVLGVKIFGVFVHGPETKRFVLRVTSFEMRYEAAFQLVLVSTIALSSGTTDWKGLLSGLSSLLVIGKVGVENFLNNYEVILSETPLLGKFYIAVSTFPVFVLTALFKIGAIAIVGAWDAVATPVLLLLALVVPGLVIFTTKTCALEKDFSLASITQGVTAELFTLHIWPGHLVGKKIGLAMTAYNFLLFSSSLAWVIATPGNGSLTSWATESIFSEWASDSAERLQYAAFSCLLLGFPTFILVVSLLLFSNKCTAKIALKFSDEQKQTQDPCAAIDVCMDNKDPEKDGDCHESENDQIEMVHQDLDHK